MQVTQTSTQTQNSTTASSSSLTETQSSDFMMMLLAQLRHQNPLEPLNDQEMMAQFTQLNSLTELQKINSTLGELGEMINASGPSELLVDAAHLVGKSVDIMQPNGIVVTGTASRVSAEMGQILVWLEDAAYPLENVIAVSEASEEVKTLDESDTVENNDTSDLTDEAGSETPQSEGANGK
ncbi:MAG: hypothetical protein DWQ07_05225 [Chloroflexi bacterium]|nr:MAG: hypothetical protein DWQ07_05225 [Chloroflexota bacterium]MBL1194835.1 hypothetical protein [Chloroflexota bacterium]NOH12126.1 hypothetical protein [Chloroflexota bacterium]